MSTIENIKEQFQSRRSKAKSNSFVAIEEDAFKTFSTLGVPTSRHEEWKYTRIAAVFNKEYHTVNGQGVGISKERFDEIRLPGCDNANELVFINGIYNDSLSTVRSAELIILSLAAAASEYPHIVSQHLDQSSKYLKDGIQALSTAFSGEGLFIYINKGQVTEHPVYIYHITDSGSMNVLAQPRCLVYISENAQVEIVETYLTIGNSESFINQVMEIVVDKNAVVGYYKIQDDRSHCNQVSTTHFRLIGKSHMHAVTISLNGDLIRNNLNIAMEAEYCEAHLYGLYFLKGKTHVDNHTVVDNIEPNCLSNQLYKGILNDSATAVFNGKIFVQRKAQKTNAYQSNKNILLSDGATVNTKPQLEIFADDVKCSHGCTIGKLDEEGLFYLRSRGISEKIARSLLVHAFAVDILEHIKLLPLRNYINDLISERLEFDIA